MNRRDFIKHLSIVWTLFLPALPELPTTLEEIKASMIEIKDKLITLMELTPCNKEEQKTILEQALKLHQEGKRLTEIFRLLLREQRAQQGMAL